MEESVAQLEPGKTENRDEALVRGKQLMRGNSLVVRFCMYGFLKNLKFFEPFLVAVLLKWNLTLTTVGALISVEKVTCYVMEIPSGYLSDRWGARKTLCSCFVLYIISFVLYYFGQLTRTGETHLSNSPPTPPEQKRAMEEPPEKKDDRNYNRLFA